MRAWIGYTWVWIRSLFGQFFGCSKQYLLTRALVQTDGESAAVVRNHFRERGKNYGRCLKTDCLWIDFGGAVFKSELQVEFEANGVRFGAYARHLPAILAELQFAKEPKGIPGHFILGGFLWRTVISQKTRDAAEEEVGKLIRKYHREIAAAERAMDEVFRGSSEKLVRKARCIYCGSGQPYVECCGNATANN